jgi:hypothetical protein
MEGGLLAPFVCVSRSRCVQRLDVFFLASYQLDDSGAHIAVDGLRSPDHFLEMQPLAFTWTSPASDSLAELMDIGMISEPTKRFKKV